MAGRARWWALIVVLGLMVAACNESPEQPAGTAAPEPAAGGGVETSSEDQIDACELLTADDAASILGVEPIVSVEFPFRIREDRTGGPDVDQPDLLGECLWIWEVPEGEAVELAQVQFYVWAGETFFAAPPLGGSETLDVAERGRIVTLPTEHDNAAYLVDFVAGGRTVWLDASVWRNPDARSVLVDISQRIAGELG